MLLLIQTNRKQHNVSQVEDLDAQLTAGQGIVEVDSDGEIKVLRTAEMVPHDLLKMIARDWFANRKGEPLLSAATLAKLDSLQTEAPELWQYVRMLGQSVLIYHEDSQKAYDAIAFARQLLAGFPQLADADKALAQAELHLSIFGAHPRTPPRKDEGRPWSEIIEPPEGE